MLQNNCRVQHEQLLHEKAALEHHAKTLLAQNEDLTREMSRFVQTDSVLRGHLDRREQARGLQQKYHDELRHSQYRIH